MSKITGFNELSNLFDSRRKERTQERQETSRRATPWQGVFSKIGLRKSKRRFQISSTVMASVGQTETQDSQPRHSWGTATTVIWPSTTKTSAGHTSTHSPQLLHFSSSILGKNIKISCMICFGLSTRLLVKWISPKITSLSNTILAMGQTSKENYVLGGRNIIKKKRL